MSDETTQTESLQDTPKEVQQAPELSHVAKARAALNAWADTYCRDSVIAQDVTQLNSIRAGLDRILAALNAIKE